MVRYRNAIVPESGQGVRRVDRPNFLFIMTDQHRPDHTGFGGNGVVETPNLDGLASRGVVFDRAYVSNPICMPNRSTIMTGRMPSVHGTRHNGISLDWRANTFVRLLRSAGYRTSHIGKSHLQTMGVNRSGMLRDVDFSLTEEAVVPGLERGWDELENIARYRTLEPVPLPDDFYGFERVDFVVSHGDICGGHYYQWLLEKGIDPADFQGPGRALENYPGWIQVYQTRLPAELYPTAYVADKCVSEIRSAAQAAAPFFIHCSFPDPHHPFSPPGDYWSRHDPADMPLPDNFWQAHEKSMPHVRAMIANRGTPAAGTADAWSPDEDQFRHALAAEFGMIELIDDEVGRIFNALREAGVADNTVVVFTSDHGDMFGDHGLILKHGLHYEGCLRVPLVVALPGSAGAGENGDEGRAMRSSSLVSSIDIPHTILELAGVDPFYGMQGHSFAELLANPAGTIRDQILIEEDERYDPFGIGHPLRIRTLVTPDARFSVYEGMAQGELYNLGNDPRENDNRWDDAGAKPLRADLTELLGREMMRLADRAPRPRYSA